MKFFVYTLKSSGAIHAHRDTVNAQPMREVLSMMVIRAGKIYLGLPRINPLDAAQGGMSEVDRWLIDEDLLYVQLLSARGREAFDALVDARNKESRTQLDRGLNSHLADIARTKGDC